MKNLLNKEDKIDFKVILLTFLMLFSIILPIFISSSSSPNVVSVLAEVEDDNSQDGEAQSVADSEGVQTLSTSATYGTKVITVRVLPLSVSQDIIISFSDNNEYVDDNVEAANYLTISKELKETKNDDGVITDRYTEVTVTCNECFPKTIKMTVTSGADTNKKVTISFDFQKRIINACQVFAFQEYDGYKSDEVTASNRNFVGSEYYCGRYATTAQSYFLHEYGIYNGQSGQGFLEPGGSDFFKKLNITKSYAVSYIEHSYTVGSVDNGTNYCARFYVSPEAIGSLNEYLSTHYGTATSSDGYTRSALFKIDDCAIFNSITLYGDLPFLNMILPTSVKFEGSNVWTSDIKGYNKSGFINLVLSWMAENPDMYLYILDHGVSSVEHTQSYIYNAYFDTSLYVENVTSSDYNYTF